MSAPPTVGFVGLGNLGLAMATRLVHRGFAVVATDLSAHRSRRIMEEGGTAASVADVLACETVCVATPDDRAVLAMLDDGTLGPGAGVRRLLLHSTVLPTAARALADRLTPLGISLLEVPVSGGPSAARAGELALFLGGQNDHLDAASEVLDALSSRQFRLGPIGAGSAVKLLNQLTMLAAVDALHEGLALTRTFEVSANAALEALAAATGDTWVGRNWGFFDAIVADYDESGTAEDERPWRKDLTEFIDASRAVSLPSPLAEHLRRSVGARIEEDARANRKGRAA